MKGVLLTADLYECAVCPATRAEVLPIAQRAVADAGLHIEGSIGGSFDPGVWGKDGGASEVTLMVPLRESHVAIHTWPLESFVSIDIYTCGTEAEAAAAIARAIDFFGARRVVRHRIERGEG